MEGVGKAGTPQGLCPGLPWVQRLCPCLERATGRDGAGLGVALPLGAAFNRPGEASTTTTGTAAAAPPAPLPGGGNSRQLG